MSDQIKKIQVENGYLWMKRPAYFSPSQKTVVHSLEEAAAMRQMNEAFSDFEPVTHVELVPADWAYEIKNDAPEGDFESDG